jgi:hypothetical protein
MDHQCAVGWNVIRQTTAAGRYISWQIEGQFRNDPNGKGMMYLEKTKPVKAGFITVIK